MVDPSSIAKVEEEVKKEKSDLEMLKQDIENAEQTKNKNWVYGLHLKQPKHKGICRYCGVSCITKNMTKVPRNEELLLKWAETLGEEFLENVRKNKHSRICWSHFKYRDHSRRNPDNFPMTDEMMNKSVTNDEFEAKKIIIKEMENEAKPNLEMLKIVVKKEENEEFDEKDIDGGVLVQDYTCTTSISLENGNKLLNTVKEE